MSEKIIYELTHEGNPHLLGSYGDASQAGVAAQALASRIKQTIKIEKKIVSTTIEPFGSFDPE